MEKIIYADFENYKTEYEVIIFINILRKELVKQGIDKVKAIKIIFESDYLAKMFLNEDDYKRIKEMFYE